jgi:hypothetical protein
MMGESARQRTYAVRLFTLVGSWGSSNHQRPPAKSTSKVHNNTTVETHRHSNRSHSQTFCPHHFEVLSNLKKCQLMGTSYQMDQAGTLAHSKRNIQFSVCLLVVTAACWWHSDRRTPCLQQTASLLIKAEEGCINLRAYAYLAGYCIKVRQLCGLWELVASSGSTRSLHHVVGSRPKIQPHQLPPLGQGPPLSIKTELCQHIPAEARRVA